MQNIITPITDSTTKKSNFPRPLNQSVEEGIEHYLLTLGEISTNNLYAIVMAQVETSMLKVVLKLTNYNQSRTATILGISRSTLRKKIKQHNIVIEME